MKVAVAVKLTPPLHDPRFLWPCESLGLQMKGHRNPAGHFGSTQRRGSE